MRNVDLHSPEYPKALLALSKPPSLWVDGGSLSTRARAVALVGPREASRLALDTTEHLAKRIAARGTIVVSGGAFGVDSAAHRGAARTGKTWVVLPCGLDQATVKEVVTDPDLYDRIRANGGALVSAFALGTKSSVPNHHARNSTIASLVTDMIVMQAAADGGSISVGRKGLAAGIRVFTFRGPCWDPLFKGTVELFGLGAVEPESLAKLVDAVAAPPRRGLTEDEKAIFQKLRQDAIHTDEVVERTGLPIGRVSSALLTLSLDDVVVEGPSGCYRRNST
ncbi:hypothetical protein BH09MYX1_BH09MYX1_27890 [soil metagenome]